MTCACAVRQRFPFASLLLLALGLSELGACAAAAQTRTAERPVARTDALTVERIAASPSLIGTAPSAPAWSPDSSHLAFLWNDEGRPARELWLVDREGRAPRRITPPADASRGAGGVTSFAWTRDSSALVYIAAGDVFRVPVRGSEPERLTTGGGDKSDLDISPDGRTISYLLDGDLYLLALAGGAPVQATHVAVPPAGTVPLGVYFHPDVEIGRAVWGGDVPAYAWSPDSRFLAVHYVDRRGVKKFEIPYYLGDTAAMNVLRRGAPGDANELRTVGIVEVATGKLRLLDLPAPAATRVLGFSFSPSGVLLIDRESDNSIDRFIHLANPEDGSLREVWHDHRESRIYNDVASAWHPDGARILITGDLDDYYRLYSLLPGEPQPKPLTRGPFDISGAAIAVPATHSILYVSSEPLPSERQVWRLASGGDAGSAPERLTTLPGMNVPSISPDGRTLALLHTDDVTPRSLYLQDARAGAAPRRLTAPPPEFAQHAWIAPRYASFKNKEGDTLHARILAPPGFDAALPGQRFPVLFGPVYSNTVRNRWAGIYGTRGSLPDLGRARRGADSSGQGLRLCLRARGDTRVDAAPRLRHLLVEKARRAFRPLYRPRTAPGQKERSCTMKPARWSFNLVRCVCVSLCAFAAPRRVLATAPSAPSAPASAASSATAAACPASLTAFAEGFWQWRARTQPFSADDIPRIERPAGLHRSWSAASVAAMRDDLRGFAGCLDKLDRKGFTKAQQVDARLMDSAIARVQWELDVNRRWQRDATFYNEQALTPLVELLAQPPPIDEARARELISRLANIPSLLEEAKVNLRGGVQPFAQLALGSLDDVREKVRQLVAGVSPLLPPGAQPPLEPRLSAAADAAAGALESYRAFLRDRAPSMTGKAPVGRAGYQFFLNRVALIPYSPEQLIAMSGQEWQRAVAAEALEKQRNAALPNLKMFANVDEQVARTVQDEVQIRRLLEERGILTVPESIRHYTVRGLPDYLAALGDFGELDDFTGPSRLDQDCVRWTPAPSPKLGYFGRANAEDPRPVVTHEGVPGHYFQLALSWSHPDPIRRHYYDSGANEGLGFYAEEMMLQAGLYDGSPRSREVIWAFARLRAARVVVDVKLALGEFTVEEAARYLVERAPMDPRTAHAEAASFATNPGQAMTYQIGKLQIVKLLAEARFREGAKFELRRFHDALWLNGNVPLALQRFEMLGLTDELEALDRARIHD